MQYTNYKILLFYKSLIKYFKMKIFIYCKLIKNKIAYYEIFLFKLYYNNFFI